MDSIEKLKENPYISRFKNAPWLNPLNIIIVGCGGIGTHSARILATQGHSLHLYDHDDYEDVNVGPQLINPNMIGANKAIALGRSLTDDTGNSNIEVHPVKYDEGSLVANIMIAAVDNMPTRKLMLEKWYEYCKKPTTTGIKLFIDGGMEAEFCAVRTIRTHAQYKRWMDEYTEESTQAPVCSFKSTSHLGFMIAGLIVSLLNNHIANKKDPDGISMRTVPYHTHFSAVTMKTSLS